MPLCLGAAKGAVEHLVDTDADPGEVCDALVAFSEGALFSVVPDLLGPLAT